MTGWYKYGISDIQKCEQINMLFLAVGVIIWPGMVSKSAGVLSMFLAKLRGRRKMAGIDCLRMRGRFLYISIKL